uniref:DUF4629 domain-containing protein n=1 Tax=Callithrix jacchus TaxID=9483 RepID=A0A8I3X2M4_CALJA|nr:uncharacterized protein C2orf78-like [Callithrix jacchus]
MSEHFQNTSLLGTANSLQLSLPVVSNAASLTGNISNFSRATAPAVSSAWLLPQASGTSFQPLTGSAYLYQHSTTSMLSGVSGQSHSSTSAASYPGIFEWDSTAKTAKKSPSLRDFTVTVTDQNTAVSSMSMTARHDKTSHANIIVPLYPTLSARLVERTQSQIPNQQGHSLSLPYQTGRQVYYYNPGTLGPQLSGELGPWLQSYGSASYPGNRASAHQPEMVMVLKEVQPTKVLPPVSTSGMHYSVSAQPSTETSFQVMETSLGMGTSLKLQSASQTFCLAQTPEFTKSCSSRNTQIRESNPSSELGDISMTAPVQSPTNLLTVSLAPSQDKTENKNLDEIKTKISNPLNAYKFSIENQNPPVLPLEVPDIHQLLTCIDPLGQGEQPGSENANLRNNSLSLQGQGLLENGSESSSDLADVTTLVENTHLPSIISSLQDLDQPKSPSIFSSLQDLDQPKSPSLFSSLQDLDKLKSPSLFSSLQDLDQPQSPSLFSSVQDLDQSKSPFIFTSLQDLDQPKSPYIFSSIQDLDQSKSPSGKKAKDPSTIKVNQVPEKSSVIKGHSDQVRKNKHKAAEPIQGAPKAKIQPKNPESLLEGEVAVCSATTSDSASVSKGKRSSNKSHKAASSRGSTTKRHGQGKTKRSRENSSKKSGDSKKSGTEVKVEEKQTIPNRKRKKNQPELTQETFKKPRTSLGMHMLESVQVFHALGKKTDKKTGLSSSRTLGSLSNTQNPRPFSALTPWLATRREGKGPDKTQVNAKKLDDNAEKECPSPSQNELPPPGKVKLVPLPFLTPDKPQARPVSRRPHPPVSHRPAVACPSPPNSTNSAQSTAVSTSQPAPTNTSLTGPARPAQPISTNATESGSTNPNQAPIASQSAASRPALYKTSSCSSLQREPVSTAVTNLQSLPKPQNQFLIQDFSLQRRPWRTPDISGPVESTPITKEQRPEREAMKRKAQQERENAAKYTSLGKLQFFIQREKDMEISEFYGYRF